MDFFPLPCASGPLFRLRGDDFNLYYAPGYLLRAAPDLVPLVEERIVDSHAEPNVPEVDTLLAFSSRAKREWNDLLERPYQPQSLHLYLNRRCQLACQYCFSDLPDRMDFSELSMDAVRAGVNLAAKNCAEKNLPLTVVFHGGGEPVLSWRLIEALQPELRKAADAYGIPLFRYIATNGVMTEERARWLARSVDLAGISMDGPPDLQSVQRPFRGSGGDATSIILRTARILRENGVPLHVRVTLTGASALRQAEICRYLCENVFPRVVGVEPVYLGGRADSSMLIRNENLDGLIESFFEARAEAQRYGAVWQVSGARPSEIHGPYCNVFRQVLQLVPEGVASACFKDVSAAGTCERGTAIGLFNGDLRLDDERVNALRAAFSRPRECEACFLGYHCAYNCPNACLLKDERSSDVLCQMLKRIFSRRLIELGGELARVPSPIAGTFVAQD